MRKTISFVTLVLGILMFTSCSSHYEEINDVVDMAVPLTKASGEIADNDGYYSVDIKLINKYLRLSGKDVAQPSIIPLQLNGNVLAYCVQYNIGWEIISGDIRCAPVVMSSETGVFNESDSDVQGVLGYINEYRTANSDVVNPVWKLLLRQDSTSNNKNMTRIGGGPEAFTIGMWRVVDTVLVDEVEEIPHIIQSHWTPNSPWNAFSPYKNGTQRSIGSLAVAAGQILHHYRRIDAKNVKFPVAAYPTSDSTDFSTEANASAQDAARWATMPLTADGPNTDHVAIMLIYLEQEVMGFVDELRYSPSYLDSIGNPFDWGKLPHSRYNGYNFDEIYYSLLNGDPVCLYASGGGTSYSAYIIDRYRIATTSYELLCRWDPEYIVSEEEYYANDPERFIESASGDEKIFTKNLITYTYWGMNWGCENTNYDGRFYMAKSYNAGGRDDAGIIPSNTHINNPYWDMPHGTTGRVYRMYYDFFR